MWCLCVGSSRCLRYTAVDVYSVYRGGSEKFVNFMRLKSRVGGGREVGWTRVLRNGSLLLEHFMDGRGKVFLVGRNKSGVRVCKICIREC